MSNTLQAGTVFILNSTESEPNSTKFVYNRGGKCIQSITLASLTALRTPASSNRSGLRRSAAGDQAPDLARPGRQVAEAWHRRGCPAPCPPLSPSPPLASPRRPAPLGHWDRSSRTPHPRARGGRRRPNHPSAREAAPLAELAPRHPHLSGTLAPP